MKQNSSVNNNKLLILIMEGKKKENHHRQLSGTDSKSVCQVYSSMYHVFDVPPHSGMERALTLSSLSVSSAQYGLFMSR